MITLKEDTPSYDEDIAIYEVETDGYIGDEYFMDPNTYNEAILTDTRACELSNYLEEDIRTITDTGSNEYFIPSTGKTYAVYTDEEADECAITRVHDELQDLYCVSGFIIDSILEKTPSNFFYDDAIEGIKSDISNLIDEENTSNNKYINVSNFIVELLDRYIVNIYDIDGINVINSEAVTIGEDDSALDVDDYINLDYKTNSRALLRNPNIIFDFENVDEELLYDKYADDLAIDILETDYEDSIDYLKSFIDDRELAQIALRNGAVDEDDLIDSIISDSSRETWIAYYDGDEIELPHYYAYRI